MAEEEDNFDIDIYGDGIEDTNVEAGIDETDQVDPTSGAQGDNGDAQISTSQHDGDPNAGNSNASLDGLKQTDATVQDTPQAIESNDGAGPETSEDSKSFQQMQDVNQKAGSLDERAIEPGASTALLISELHWWINDDDIRGWANECQSEDELEDVTFSEHKVNGKSKGQVYVLFQSPQAATATKRHVESMGEKEPAKKFTVGFANPLSNPFKTLPKDGPMKNSGPMNNTRPNNFTGPPQGPSGTGFNNNASAGFRGGRGGNFNNRGTNNMNMGGFNRGGFNQAGASGFQGSGMGGFQNNPIGNMQSYGGFQNRGGMRGGPMSMRGGRGGMMGMPFTNMGFPNMAMGMNLPQMAASMGMPGQGGFPGGQAFNPAMFNQHTAASSSDGNWNPHGAKRPRQE